jgi:uncharacterized protein (TIGR00251 family)
MAPRDDRSAWYRYDGASRLLVINVHVQPNARTSAITGLHGDALKIRVAAPAVDNKANAALVGFLARVLGVAPETVSLRRGARGRRKSIEIRDAPPEFIAQIESSLTANAK